MSTTRTSGDPASGLTPPSLPAVLDFRFELGPVVGQGGMATVFRARDLTTGDDVAVKVLRDDIVPPGARARFAREVSLTGALSHPGILEIIATGESAGHPYYVMPLVGGQSLKDRLGDGVSLPVSEAVEIAAQVAAALAHAHDRGIIHRDIKPANILTDGGRVLLVDFGIARAIDVATADRLTESGVAIGTAHYMSPEQAAGGKVDARSDIYSLGCVLYEMLLGTPPFNGSTAQQVLARHAASPVPGMRDVRRTITPELEAVVMRALEKVPADRFANVAEFVAALHSPRITPGWRRLVRGRRRRVAAGTGVLAVAAVATVLLTGASPQLSADRVLVLPLVSSTPGLPDGGATLGENAATLIGASLDGVGKLRTVDGWRLLEPEQRDDISRLTARQTRRLAQRAGARYVLSGRMVPRQDTVVVVLDLLDAGADTVVMRASATASMADGWRAALRAVNLVLPRLTGTEAVNVGAPLMERAPKAVAAYLQGEAEYRRLRMPQALASFREALGHDSALFLAALRGSQAAGWNHNYREAGELARVALRHRLSPRDAHFARGYAAYVEGRADSAANELRRAIELDSSMVIAWMQLAETYTHLLPVAGAVDSAAAAALERAYALDPGAAPVAHHLAWNVARKGDARRTLQLIEVLRTSQGDTALQKQLELMHRCITRPDRRLDWSEDARVQPLVLLLAAHKLAATGAQPRCAADAFSATLAVDTARDGEADGRRFAALIGLVGLRHAQGDSAAATAALDAFIRRWGYGSSLLVRQAMATGTYRDRAREVWRADSAAFGADLRGAANAGRLWLFGVWAAKDGNLAMAERAARKLDRIADTSGSARDRRHAKSIRAYVALARGQRDTALIMMEQLLADPLPSDSVQWDEFATMADERTTVAALGLYRNPGRALQIANVFDSTQPAVFLLYLRPSLEIRVQLARVLRDEPLANTFRNRLAALQASAQPTR